MNATALLFGAARRVRRTLAEMRAVMFEDLPGDVVIVLVASLLVIFAAKLWLVTFVMVAIDGASVGSERLGVLMVGAGPVIPAMLLCRQAMKWARWSEPVTFIMLGYPLYARELW